MNGTNTLVGPGAGDAALLRIKGTGRALALSLDGPGRLGALDPRLAGVAAVVEGALNVACSGATPIGITNCLNFASPERPEGYWELAEAVAGMAEACVALGIPIVSGNVSLYNETPDGPILPTPVVGTVGLLDDRARAIPMRWSDGDEIWLLGAAAWDAGALAASELAWRRGRFGGEPSLDLPAAGRLVRLLQVLGDRGLVDRSPRPLGRRPRRLRSRGWRSLRASARASPSRPRRPSCRPPASSASAAAGRWLRWPAAAVERLHAAAGDLEVSVLRLGVASGDRLDLAVGSGRLAIGARSARARPGPRPSRTASSPPGPCLFGRLARAPGRP